MSKSGATRILVTFYSRNGAVEALAKAIVEGAEAEGAEVRLRRAPELVGAEVMALAPGWRENAARMSALYPAPTVADAEWADGLLFGAPTRFGAPASELRAYMESLGGLWLTGRLVGKPAGAFTSASSPHGGLETTILAFYPAFAHLGMVIAPLGYTIPELFTSGTPYGAAAVSRGASAEPPTADDLLVARRQGAQMALLARKLKAD